MCGYTSLILRYIGTRSGKGPRNTPYGSEFTCLAYSTTPGVNVMTNTFMLHVSNAVKLLAMSAIVLKRAVCQQVARDCQLRGEVGRQRK